MILLRLQAADPFRQLCDNLHLLLGRSVSLPSTDTRVFAALLR